jgi:hypothetical protein
MPNFHNNESSTIPQEKYGDSLYIFITADLPTSGTITYRDNAGQEYKSNFAITDVNKIFTFKVSWWDFELKGVKFSSGSPNKRQAETVNRTSFHVESKDDIIVYAHSQANTTSDAFILIPTDALDTNYFILTYKSDGDVYDYFGNPNYIDGGSTPSQFSIVATEDDTRVSILPSTETQYNNRTTQNIVLDKGEVYLVQAKIDRFSENRDLTGTEIYSNKPVAVFAGHQRSHLPIITSASNPSRDFLCEQMPGVNSWGTNALLVPYPPPIDVTSSGTDLFRVLASEDGTNIYINKQFITTLNAGEFYEAPLINGMPVEGDKPILVAQFKKTSSQSSSQGDFRSGDPFLMIIPPVEQFGNFYRFINIQAWEYGLKIYNEQYITIVVPDEGISTMLLDDAPVNPGRFIKIPNSGFSYAFMKMTDGTHTVSCLEQFGLYVYGYGEANSYGYFGGMNFKRIDMTAPKITSNPSCFKINGIATDSAYKDTQLSEVTAPADLRINVNVNIESFTPYAKVVKFDASLIDTYQDGEFTLIAVDSFGLSTRKVISIPGNTMRILGANGQQPKTETDTTKLSSESCRNYSIENYGKFPQTINLVDLLGTSGKFRIKGNPQLTIDPGKTATIEVCFISDEEGTFHDTLFIRTECSEKIIGYFEFTAIGDRHNPDYEVTGDSCKANYYMTITESLPYDFGIEKIVVDRNENCTVETSSFQLRESKLKVTVTDPYQDAFYKISVYDAVGNVTIIEDAIPGFTLGFGSGADDNYIEFGERVIGTLNCGKIPFYNYGAFTLKIDKSHFYRNLVFSMPPSQLPFEIEPGDTAYIDVCFFPGDARPEFDTLVVHYGCYDRILFFSGEGLDKSLAGSSRCGQDVGFTISRLNTGFVAGDVYPVPVSTMAYVDISSGSDRVIYFNLRDSFGNTVFESSGNFANNSSEKVEINTNGLASGIYFLEISDGLNNVMKKMIITK